MDSNQFRILWNFWRRASLYASAVALFSVSCWLSVLLSGIIMDLEKKYDAEYLSADEFYKTFKVFKKNLKEDGPNLIVDVLRNHTFENKEIKV